MSGTLPPHIKATVEEVLREACTKIELTSNRPNITYAASPITSSFNDWHNLDFVIPRSFNPDDQPKRKTVVFIDNTQSTVELAQHLDQLLPRSLRGKGFIKNYHSKMSSAYLDLTYNDFADPTGQCRWLIATEGASTVESPFCSLVLVK